MEIKSAKSSIDDFVSIIMPVFNAEKKITRAVSSVLEQTFKNFELIIVNDCSTDLSAEILSKLINFDDRIKVINLTINSGAGIARNKGIYSSKGNIIAFLDADDAWLPQKLEVQIQAMRKANAVLVCSGYDVYSSCGDLKETKIPKRNITYDDILKSNYVGCLTVIYDSGKIGKQYMPKIRKRQDYALWLTLIKKYGPAHCVQKSLASYHLQDGSISSNKVEMLLWNYKMFRQCFDFNIIYSIFLTARNGLYKLL